MKLIHIAMFAALATIVSLFRIPIFFAPGFYKIDFSNTIVLISGFSLGPMAGILTSFFKAVLKFTVKGSSTMAIGEFANFIIGISLVLPSALIYKKYRTFKGACVSMCFGILCAVLVSALTNYFVLLPLYENLLGISETKIILIAQSINPLITDKVTFILWTVIPFNLLEGLLVCTFSLVLYKKLSGLINNSLKK